MSVVQSCWSNGYWSDLLEKPMDDIQSSDATVERLAAADPISVIIPPLDLSTLCQHNQGM